MSIITSKYKSDSAKRFVSEVLADDYYIFVSSTDPIDYVNAEQSEREFLEKTIFGKKVLDDNVFFMIRNYPWQVGQVYEQYDDTQDISDKKFYAIVYPNNNETGDYRIYKCLFNNYGATVSDPPNYNESTPDQVYEMTDGYKWKFMYSLTEVEFDQFNARGYIPIPGANTEFTGTSSQIDQILIENPTVNTGYEEARGFLDIVNTEVGAESKIFITDVDISSSTEFPLNEIEDYYKGMMLWLTNGSNQSEVYEINSYEWDPGSQRGNITVLGDVELNSFFVSGVSYKILPKVEIRGDGTGAIAIPVLDGDTIVNIKLLEKGSGYTTATAEVVNPPSYDPLSTNSLDIKAILRVVVSPKGGHGSNLIEELACRHVLVHASITNTDNESIPTTNNFASVGLVKDPEFRSSAPDIFDNRLIVSLDEFDLSVGDTVVQIESSNTSSVFYDKRIFEGVVHEIAANNTVYLTDYMGSFPPSTNTSINDTSFRDDIPLRSTENAIYAINIDNDPVYPDGLPDGFSGYHVPDYIQRTGSVYFMNSFLPVARTETANEQFKIILEF